jgi:hypothetical protein
MGACLVTRRATPAGTIPLAEHDVPVDLVITPDRLIDCRGRHGPRPVAGIRWPELTPEKIAAIPCSPRSTPGTRPGESHPAAATEPGSR